MIPAQLKANDIATSDGASISLSALSLKHERFSLTKPEFFDAILLRYRWGNFNVYHTNTTLTKC